MLRTFVSPSIKIRVLEKVIECITKLEKHYAVKLRRPKLLFEKRGTVAAVANSDNWYINLNPILLNENVDEFIENTIPHEICHLVCDEVYPSQRYSRNIHGPRWREMMGILGAQAEAFHTYDVTNSRLPHTNTVYRYACTGCKKTFDVGIKRHTSLVANPGAFWHTDCGKAARLQFVDVIVTPPPHPAPLAPPPTLDAYFKIYTQAKDKPKDEVVSSFVQLLHCSKRRAATVYTVCKRLPRTIH